MWKPVKATSAQGMIDLGALFTQDAGQSAFGTTDVISPARGPGQLVIGSDDTLTVWLNGDRVYTFSGDRSFNPDQGRVDVELLEGVNRLLIQCGNTGGQWQFAVALTLPAAGVYFDAERAQALREALAGKQAEAHAALERLDQVMAGQAPADLLAAELAADQHALRDRLALFPRATQALDQKRIAAALRALHVRDASLAQSEAVRLAERAAEILDNPKTDPGEAVRQATEAVDMLARTLVDDLQPHEQIAALARAQRALNDPGPLTDSRARAATQRAIAEALVVLPRDDTQAAARLLARAVKDAEAAAHTHPESQVTFSSPTAQVTASAQAAAALEGLAARLAQEFRTKPQPPPITRHPPPADVQILRELGLKPGKQVEAAHLVQRERQIREQLQAITNEPVAPQEALRDEAFALGRVLEALRDRAHDVSSHSQGPANAALHALTQQATEAMGQAAAHGVQGQLDQARNAQRHAAQGLQNAAQQVDEMANALLADRPTEAAAPSTGEVSKAQDAQRRAVRALSQAREPTSHAEAARAAGESMHQAAQSLRSVAQQAGSSQPSPSQASQAGSNGQGNQPPQAANPSGQPATAGTADLSGLKVLMRAPQSHAWGELPGHLRNAILQMPQSRYREEYSHLIQLYFQELAAGTATNEKP